VERSRDHESKKLNLDVAANRLGVALKTLDEYHLCIRRAEDYGFNF